VGKVAEAAKIANSEFLAEAADSEAHAEVAKVRYGREVFFDW
jgi:hypothetical protein